MTNWTIYQGEALMELRKLPSDSVDMVCTDPPYMISSEIKIGRAANTRYAASTDIDLDFGEWDKQWGSNEEYLAWSKCWLSEAVRVLRPYHHLIMFCDKKKITPIWEYMESIGCKGRSPLYWIKSNPV